MKKSIAIALTLIVATFAVGMPVGLAIEESERRGLEAATERALGYARDILRRSDSTVDQVTNGFARLKQSGDTVPCSEANLGLMRQIDLSSKYVQAIGYMDGEHLVCSSLGRDTKGLLIGSPDFTTRLGVAVHKNLRLPFAPQESFIALEQDHYVAIIHKDLPIDITTTEKDSSLAIFALDEPMPMSSRGFKCVFEVLARDTHSFLKRQPDFHIAINLSAADLHSPQLLPLLDRLLMETGADPQNVIVEITERGLLNVETVRQVLDDVRAKGCAIAIDDFGTGYSSLSYLETLEVDFLKIDKSFIDAIATEAPTSNVVHHIIGMAKSLKLRMIAEGVETQAQAQFLRERGVEYAQGWLFGKPMPFAELEQRIAHQHVEVPRQATAELRA